MDAVKEKSLTRIKGEIETYELLTGALELEPAENNHILLPLLKHLLTMHRKTVDCVENDKPFLASQFTNPVEILTAMDVDWYFHLQQIWMGVGIPNPYLQADVEALDSMPIARDVCTALRLGVHFMDLGILPVPTAYLALTEPCDGISGLHTAFSRYPEWRDVPIFAPDPPYFSDDRSFEYYAGELKRMVEFITKHTGKTLDMNRLKEVVEETNKGYALWQEYCELRRAVPTPHSYQLPCSCFFVLNSQGAGNPEWTDWYRTMLADAEMRVRENKPEVPNQKIRVFWYDLQPLFMDQIAPWLEQEWGAVIAMCMTSYCPYKLIDTSSEDAIFKGLAERVLMHPPMIRQAKGTVDLMIDDFNRIIKDYKIDVVIWPGHMGHKDQAASVGFARDVCRDLGVGFLYMGMDQFDQRYMTVDEIKDKISQYFTAMGYG